MKINIAVKVGRNTFIKLASHKKSSGHIFFLKQATQILSGHVILESKQNFSKYFSCIKLKTLSVQYGTIVYKMYSQAASAKGGYTLSTFSYLKL
jgi:hypothetical protein